MQGPGVISIRSRWMSWKNTRRVSIKFIEERHPDIYSEIAEKQDNHGRTGHQAGRCTESL